MINNGKALLICYNEAEKEDKMVKKLLFDRYNFACRGETWIADGEYEIKTGEAQKIGPVFVADKPWER